MSVKEHPHSLSVNSTQLSCHSACLIHRFECVVCQYYVIQKLHLLLFDVNTMSHYFVHCSSFPVLWNKYKFLAVLVD